MGYRFDVIGRWWEYMYPLFGIALIVNLFVGYFIIGNPDGIVGVIMKHLESTTRGSPLFTALLVLGPLFNIYVAVVSAKQAIEADDDFFHFNEKADIPARPTAAQRKRLISTLSILTGFVLLRFTFWSYTASVDALWHLEQPFYTQPGIAASIGVVFAIYFIAPKLFPSAARRLSKIEDVFTDGLSNLDRD